MSKFDEAVAHAKLIIERALGDDEYRVLAEQHLRLVGQLSRLEQEARDNYDPYGDLIQANRDATMEIQEESLKRISKVLIGGGNLHDAEKLKYIGEVLYAVSMFHPMHCESWKGWPE